ncbi:DUF2568 domain-containing protein [Rhodobacterales bacterium HKCCE3408]|nr:DUF2568 domain-containing protein [Rhodobacterales bacterium HKCCE3408]
MVAANQALALAVELALLLAVGHAAFVLSGGTGPLAAWTAAAAAVGVVAILWGRFAAPKSRTRLGGTALLAFKIALFAVGAAAFVLGGWPVIAVVFALAVAIHLVLATRLGAL